MAIVLDGSSGITTPGLDASGINKFATTIGVGNATPSGSGAGITFPATQSASSNANTLDDYEEGTWTPTVSSTTTNPTVSAYETRVGVYTKVGNVVTVMCMVRATLSSAGSGSTQITGLPFPAGYAYPSPAIGLRNLLTGTISPYMVGSAVLFDGGTWSTAANNYIGFTLSYQTT